MTGINSLILSQLGRIRVHGSKSISGTGSMQHSSSFLRLPTVKLPGSPYQCPSPGFSTVFRVPRRVSLGLLPLAPVAQDETRNAPLCCPPPQGPSSQPWAFVGPQGRTVDGTKVFKRPLQGRFSGDPGPQGDSIASLRTTCPDLRCFLKRVHSMVSGGCSTHGAEGAPAGPHGDTCPVARTQGVT